MLILSRKFDEDVVIQTPAGLITVRVIEIGPHRVRLGFEAPRTVPIHRREVWDEIVQREIAQQERDRRPS